MTEADIVEQVSYLMEITLVGISAFFTIVSAYVVALFYFLNRAPWLFKVVAFLFFTMTCAFLSLFALGAQDHSRALCEALLQLQADGHVLGPVGQAALARASSDIDAIIQGVMWSGLMVIYLSFFYFTFIYRWPRYREA